MPIDKDKFYNFYCQLRKLNKLNPDVDLLKYECLSDKLFKSSTFEMDVINRLWNSKLWKWKGSKNLLLEIQKLYLEIRNDYVLKSPLERLLTIIKINYDFHVDINDYIKEGGDESYHKKIDEMQWYIYINPFCKNASSILFSVFELLDTIPGNRVKDLIKDEVKELDILVRVELAKLIDKSIVDNLKLSDDAIDVQTMLIFSDLINCKRKRSVDKIMASIYYFDYYDNWQETIKALKKIRRIKSIDNS